MSRRSALGDWVIVLFVAGWVVSVFILFTGMSGEEREAAFAAPEASAPSGPADLPAPLAIGTEADPVLGLVERQQEDFDREEQIAFSLWLGRPIGPEPVRYSLVQLTSDGFVPVGEARTIATVPTELSLHGSIAAGDIVDEFGVGTFAIIVTRGADERLATGAVQIEATAPQSVDSFPEWRPVTVSAGEQTGYRFSPAGEIIDRLSLDARSAVEAHSNHRAVWNGEPYLFVTDGDWAGYWLPEPEAVTVAD